MLTCLTADTSVLMCFQVSDNVWVFDMDMANIEVFVLCRLNGLIHQQIYKKLVHVQ